MTYRTNVTENRVQLYGGNGLDLFDKAVPTNIENLHSKVLFFVTEVCRTNVVQDNSKVKICRFLNCTVGMYYIC